MCVRACLHVCVHVCVCVCVCIRVSVCVCVAKPVAVELRCHATALIMNGLVQGHLPKATSSALDSASVSRHQTDILLAHLRQRLIGELIGYSWSSVRPLSSVVNNFKHLLQNRLPDESQILCGASLGRGNESLFVASGSHDQNGHHAHIW